MILITGAGEATQGLFEVGAGRISIESGAGHSACASAFEVATQHRLEVLSRVVTFEGHF